MYVPSSAKVMLINWRCDQPFAVVDCEVRSFEESSWTHVTLGGGCPVVRHEKVTLLPKRLLVVSGPTSMTTGSKQGAQH